MGLYRRKGSKIWCLDFWFRGKRFQQSTGCSNKNDAKQVEAKVRSEAALAKFGIGPQKASPPLAEFMNGAFLQHVEKHAKTKSTAVAYRNRVNRLLKWPRWRDLPLSQISGDIVNGFISFRSSAKIVGVAGPAITSKVAIPMDGHQMSTQTKRVSVPTLNSELAVLRIALNLAEEWGLCQRIKVRLLPGAKGREFVVGPDLERAYLEAATYPLKQVAILMLDLGLRPEEAVSLRKVDIQADTVHVRQGKTVNSVRILPTTERAKTVVSLCSALFPDSPYLFKGYKGHMTAQYISELHAKLRCELGRKELATRAIVGVAPPGDIAVRPIGMPANAEDFKLYSFRHTAITRLVEAGAGVYEVKQFAGHADIRMSAKYVHISTDHLGLAVKRMEELGKIMRNEVHSDSGSEQKVPH